MERVGKVGKDREGRREADGMCERGYASYVLVVSFFDMSVS